MCLRITATFCLGIAASFGVTTLSACKSTPLDVVYATDVAPVADAAVDSGVGGAAGGVAGASAAGVGGASLVGGAAGAGGVDTGACSVVGPGSFVLRSRASGLCLGQGAPTTVFGQPGFLLDFAAECRQPARSWQLEASAVPNVFALRNAVYGLVLDVQMGATRDGTPVIIFSENNLDNQRFEVRARDAFASEIRPQHHPQSCVAAAALGAQITTCDPADSTQAWLLQRSDCL